VGGLVLPGDTLYGTTSESVSGTGGTVFKMATDGTGFTVLSDGSDGASPQAGLLLSGGAFYGTTAAGGVAGAGTVFRVNEDGTGYAMLHSFSPVSLDTNSDGSTPMGTLALSGTSLYGTTKSGGTYYALMSTNPILPLSQWTPVATNVLSASGNFTITVTNTVNSNVPHRFYILETQ